MTVVFMAPIGNDAASWERVDVAATAAKHQFPGFGRPRAETQPTMASLADEVAASHPGPLHLIGVSMGGMVGQHVALRHPDRVRSLMVACTGAGVDPALMRERAAAAEEGGMEAVLDSTLERWFTPEALDRRPEHAGVAYARTTLAALDPLCFADGWRAIATHDARPRLPELRLPVTALAGTRDAASPRQRSEEIAELTQHGRLVLVPDAPHMVHLECPGALSTAIREHLRWAGMGTP
ncbi:MAG: alpha/beta fold hydrolase [Solirubrobacteraceae bacterium]